MAQPELNNENVEFEGDELVEKVVHINRVAKVVKGGRRFHFTALVVVGDGNGNVGVGYGKANEVPEAIRKGTEKAKNSMFEVPLENGTIPHVSLGVDGSGRVLLKPASAGTGVIAGGTVRAIIESVGIKDLLTKSLGSNKPKNVLNAAVVALKALENQEMVAKRRGKAVADIR